MINSFKFTDQHKRLAIQIVAGIVFSIFGYMLAVRPVASRIHFLREAAGNAKERSSLISEIHQLKVIQKKMAKPLLKENDRHLILGEINDLANKNGLEVASLAPTVTPEQNYVRLTLELTAQSSFASFMQFLKALEEFKSDISVSHLTLNTQAVGKRMVSINLVLETYLKKGNEPH